VRSWSELTEIPASRFIEWIGVQRGKFYDWRRRYGKTNEHNALVPRDHWLEPWEREAILAFQAKHPLDGYRRLAFMMLDADVVAVSPTTVWRVLHQAGVIDRWNKRSSKKGTGFVQPLKPHDHWHIDVSYLNIAGTFYYLFTILDGCSRAVIHWDLRESMTEQQVECILQRARELYPDASPRIISDNGPQFIARDFKEFIRVTGMDHVRTSPYYPQSNGKIERYHKTIKEDAIRVTPPATLDEARRLVTRFVEHYNTKRLHSAIGYVTPHDVLHGRQKAIHEARDRKLEAARETRAQRRHAARESVGERASRPAGPSSAPRQEAGDSLHL
jgi:transposase InsO family protein